MAKPAFDPSQPYESVKQNAKPPFDPSQPFDESPKEDPSEKDGPGILSQASGLIDRFGGAPIRAGLGKLQEGKYGEIAPAYMRQFGEDPKLAPTGEEMSLNAGVPEQYAPYAGFAVDVATDPLTWAGPGLMGKAAEAIPAIKGLLKSGKTAEALAPGEYYAGRVIDPRLNLKVARRTPLPATPSPVASAAKQAPGLISKAASSAKGVFTSNSAGAEGTRDLLTLMGFGGPVIAVRRTLNLIDKAASSKSAFSALVKSGKVPIESLQKLTGKTGQAAVDAAQALFNSPGGRQMLSTALVESSHVEDQGQEKTP